MGKLKNFLNNNYKFLIVALIILQILSSLKIYLLENEIEDIYKSQNKKVVNERLNKVLNGLF